MAEVIAVTVEVCDVNKADGTPDPEHIALRTTTVVQYSLDEALAQGLEFIKKASAKR